MQGTVADTTVLSNFAHVRQSSLLAHLFSPLSAPPSVLEELDRGVRAGSVPDCDWSWLEAISLTVAETEHAAELRASLDPGESECIAVANARGWVLLTDDRVARRRASRLGLEVSGTLGCLDLLVREEHLVLEHADALLAEMIVCGYRSPINSLREESRG